VNVYDFWGGRSFFLDKGYREYLNLSLRNINERYKYRPYVSADSNLIFHDQTFYLMSLSYVNINYFKTNRLLGYGVTEDVPYGMALKLTAGFQKNQFVTRLYSAISFVWAKYFQNIGYLTYGGEIGGYPKNREIEDMLTNIRLVYYSPLIHMNRFSLRHFVSPSFSSINNTYYFDWINFENRIQGLNQSRVFGLSTLVVKYEPFFYTPYSFLGFKLAASIYMDAGWIYEQPYLAGSSDFYSSFGSSFHIKNESFTIPTLTIRVGYYPKYGEEKNKFKFTVSFKDRILFEDFISPKPELNLRR
jgi:hypothetical protein